MIINYFFNQQSASGFLFLVAIIVLLIWITLDITKKISKRMDITMRIVFITLALLAAIIGRFE